LKPDQINFTDTSPTNELQDPTQRHYFGQCAVGLGTIAVNCLLARDGIAAPRRPQIDPAKPMAPRKPPQPAKAKRVIDLFMAGAPSQLELFEDKPKLRELSRLPPPPSLMKGKRFAFLKGNETLMGTRRKFAQYGQSGATLSELLPNHQKIADDVTWLQGKILIDATNPLGMTEKGLALTTGFSTSGAEKIAALAPTARLVKCFNQTGFGNMAEPKRLRCDSATIASLGFSNRVIVRAHVAAAHQAFVVEFPMLIAVRAKPLPGCVVPFVFKPHRDAVVRERPQLFHQAIIEFFGPFAAQEFLDGFAPAEKLRAVAPFGIFRIRERDSFGVT
jgi:hypothetical protein